MLSDLSAQHEIVEGDVLGLVKTITGSSSMAMTPKQDDHPQNAEHDADRKREVAAFAAER